MELQSSLTYVSDYSHPKLENTSDSIARNNEEISKQATSLIRLIKKIQTDRQDNPTNRKKNAKQSGAMGYLPQE